MVTTIITLTTLNVSFILRNSYNIIWYIYIFFIYCLIQFNCDTHTFDKMVYPYSEPIGPQPFKYPS